MDLVKIRTGKGIRAWVNHIQRLIPKYTTNRNTDLNWIHELIDCLLKKQPNGKYDENMWLCSNLGTILLAWYLRLHKAKSYDPNRPIKHRKRALKQWVLVTLQLHLLMVDETIDHLLFPGQEWEPPFNPNAKNGTFV